MNQKTINKNIRSGTSQSLQNHSEPSNVLRKGVHRSNLWLLTKACSIAILVVLTSCEDFVDIPLSSNFIGDESVFATDATSTAVATGMYNKMLAVGSFANSGTTASTTTIAGLTADELVSEFTSAPEYQLPYVNNLLPTSQPISDSWTSAYNIIYISNIVIEGLPTATGLTPSLQSQLLGEAYFVRAFVHFYLVNMYGEIPIITSSDFATNVNQQRASINDVYGQIITDLKQAEILLTNAEIMGAYKFVATERIRPNSYAAKFLLARTYLFMGDWTNAELYASSVINKTDTYSILTDLNQVFKPNTTESIWQLKPIRTDGNTGDGAVFVLNAIPGTAQNPVSLSASIINDFEAGDKRKTSWIGQFISGTRTWNYAFKYKLKGLPTGGEYSVVFRLAEMYLVRAEARARTSKVMEAIQDVDVIRSRAGITLIKNTNPGISSTSLLDVILHERKVELFAEWGHRWMDLKRFEKADMVLSSIKGSNWQATDKLYPIPLTEVTNGNRSQNQGY